ncbi:MAG: hypothetical protein GF317_04780 [Candidatus Lokiarchaeota archaeon]|nr:hypothetical protein [Candidatus Lokiarchaeota archaeon]
MKKKKINSRENIKDLFINGLADSFSDEGKNKNLNTDYNEVWRYKPASSEDFFKYFVQEPLWKKQQEFCDVIFGKDPLCFRDITYDTFLAFWGKGSGKDRTISKIFTYIAYLLCCLKEPQVFFGLAPDSPLDLLNVASTGDQAKDVFFMNFKALVRRTIDPDSGLNWFATKNYFPITEVNEMGESVVVSNRCMDLREEKDIQKRSIYFGNLITAYSGNSRTYQGEGKNLIAVAFDELGAFDPIKALGSGGVQAKNSDLFGSLHSTVTSRSAYGLVMAFSYKYNENCPMSIVYERSKKERKTYAMRSATWQVNPNKKKQDFSEDYLKNPEASMMRYECKSTGYSLNRFFRRSYIAEDGINYERENPIVGDKITTNQISLLKFKPFFKGKEGCSYTVHIDGAKGKVFEGGDAAGFTLAHPVLMKPKIDERALKETKLGVDFFKRKYFDEDAQAKGVYIDLFFQITAPEGGEIALSDLRGFIYFLKKFLKFNIRIVTVDGWQSLDTIQQLQRKGYKADLLSVDKNPEAYDTLKELEYQYLVDRYKNSIYERELSELEDVNGRVDHPELSHKRAMEEGVLKGSKDVSDSVAGACIKAMELPVASKKVALV